MAQNRTLEFFDDGKKIRATQEYKGLAGWVTIKKEHIDEKTGKSTIIPETKRGKSVKSVSKGEKAHHKHISKGKEDTKIDWKKASLRKLTAVFGEHGTAQDIKLGRIDLSGKPNIRNRSRTESGTEGTLRERTKSQKELVEKKLESGKEEYGKKLLQTAIASSMKYAMAHPGKQGRPEVANNKRDQIAAEKKNRAAIRHINSLNNYMTTHPVHDIPVTIDGKTSMVPTTHKYLETMEINKGQLNKQSFSYKGFKEYNYAPQKNTSDIAKEFTSSFTSGVKSNKPVDNRIQTGGFNAGAYSNMAKDLYKVKSVTNFDKKYGGKK